MIYTHVLRRGAGGVQSPPRYNLTTPIRDMAGTITTPWPRTLSNPERQQTSGRSRSWATKLECSKLHLSPQRCSCSRRLLVRLAVQSRTNSSPGFRSHSTTSVARPIHLSSTWASREKLPEARERQELLAPPHEQLQRRDFLSNLQHVHQTATQMVRSWERQQDHCPRRWDGDHSSIRVGESKRRGGTCWRGGDMFWVSFLPSGRSVLFSVPPATLKRRRKVYVEFQKALEPTAERIEHTSRRRRPTSACSGDRLRSGFMF